MTLVYFSLRPNHSTYRRRSSLSDSCVAPLFFDDLLLGVFTTPPYFFRDVDITEKLHYSSTIALLGFSPILAIIRAFNVRTEAARAMVDAPLLAFLTTHILYLNLYQFDYGLNMIVCATMGLGQILLWAIWAGITHHPSRWKLWVVMVGGGFTTLLLIYDFSPYWGYVDAHALWHATSIPLSFLWWSFIKDDGEF